MSEVVTITRWRDAKTDPPFEGVRRLTDTGGMGVYRRRSLLYPETGWRYWCGGELMNPQPRWWCDPQAPGKDALTVNEFDHIIEGGIKGRYTDPDVLARLRAALGALDRKEDTP